MPGSVVVPEEMLAGMVMTGVIPGMVKLEGCNWGSVILLDLSLDQEELYQSLLHWLDIVRSLTQ